MDIKFKSTDELLLSKFKSLTSAKDVADLLEVEYKQFLYILYKKGLPSYYKKFNIKKKTNGEREICAPFSSVKILQTKLNHILSMVYIPKICVHGYANRKSIVTNARSHLRKKFILNMDLKDFFPSINFGRVRGFFINYFKMHESAATVLAHICCFENKLPQGAPTSPIISNFICSKMDSELMSLAKKYSCTYTRYADDLTFSSTRKHFPSNLEKEVCEIVVKNGFSINPSKTRLQNRNQRLEVTGIKVNEKPNVRRTYIRQIRSMLHAWEKFGLEQAEEEYYMKYSSGNKNPELPIAEFSNILKGKINYLRMVRGENDQIYQRLAIRYNRLALTLDKSGGVFPFYDQVEKISSALWVTNSESEYELLQGTAFMLEGIGLVTCAHIIAPFPSKTIVHRYDNPTQTFEAKVEHIDNARDIAILSIEKNEKKSLKMGDSRSLQIGSNIIVAGFPNHSEDDSPYFHWGKVTLFRRYKVNAIEFQERFMVSATIIAGNSGGPVCNSDGEVVGIAVTGQELFIPPKEQNEKHGVIRIEEILRFVKVR